MVGTSWFGRVRPRIVFAIVVVAAAAVLPSPASAAGLGTGSWIRSTHDDRCLQVTGMGDETPIIGATCDPESIYQSWEFIVTDHVGATPYYAIRNVLTQKCLLVRSFGSAAYKAVQYPCMPYPDQYWRLPIGQGNVLNRAHERCLVLRSWQTQAMADTCAGYPDQVFVIVDAPA